MLKKIVNRGISHTTPNPKKGVKKGQKDVALVGKQGKKSIMVEIGTGYSIIEKSIRGQVSARPPDSVLGGCVNP